MTRKTTHFPFGRELFLCSSSLARPNATIAAIPQFPPLRMCPAFVSAESAHFNSDQTDRQAGQRSEEMFFDLGYADGISPVLAMPERPVPNGARAG
jgi:hypothetical protein